MTNDDRLRDCLKQYVRGALSRDELEGCLESRARFRFWDTNERSLENSVRLPKIVFSREDVDRQLKRFLNHQMTADQLSDWAGILRLLDCFDVDEPDPSSSAVWDLIDELVSPDVWGAITVDSVIDLRRRLAVA